jgi:anti-anti-sigma factor
MIGFESAEESQSPQTHLQARQVLIFVLEGELLERELTELGKELVRRAARGNVTLLLDLADVTHLDYRGVPGLVMRTESIRAAGGDVKLCGASPYLRAIFAASGAFGVFEFFRDVDEARHTEQRLVGRWA